MLACPYRGHRREAHIVQVVSGGAHTARGGLVIDAGRLARAVWLDCRPVGLGGFMVRGGRDDHVVDVDAVYVRCDCVDSQTER